VVLLNLDDPNLVVAFWKPYDCLTAFTDRDGRSTLADYIDIPDVYAAGRLDRDSEGLLLLTRGKALRGALMDPRLAHPRRYLVQVEGVPTSEALDSLSRGVDLKDGRTRPAQAELLETAPDLPPRPVPIRVRKSIPDSWVRLTLTEGKNRQVRRMTAAVGFPTLRLVRDSIGSISLNGLAPGQWRVLTTDQRDGLTRALKQPGGASRSGSGRSRSRRR